VDSFETSHQANSMRPNSLADAVEQHRAGRDFWVALNEFLDEFYAAGDERQSMIEQEPALIGDMHLDAYIGAVGEHLTQRWRLEHIPCWTSAKERSLDCPWFPGAETPKLHNFQLVYSPIAFRRRDIFTEAEPLRRPGMPRDSATTANEELWAEWFGPSVGEVEVRVVVEGVIHLEDSNHRR
jgi:hypothetical protein